jgi:hypothetical protein
MSEFESEPLDLPAQYFGQKRRRSAIFSVGWLLLGVLVYVILIAGVLGAGVWIATSLGITSIWVIMCVAAILGSVLGYGGGKVAAKCFFKSKRLRAPSAVEVWREINAPQSYTSGHSFPTARQGSP